MTRTGILLTGEYVWYKVILRFISFLFKSIWLFFPAILFVVLGIWCFWMLGQGKDIIVAFGENPRAKIYFVLAVALWAYLSWFSSRIIAYQKLFKQIKTGGFESNFDYAKFERTTNVFSFDLPQPWLEIFPRILGFACFLVIELALLQLKYYGTPGWSPVAAAILFFGLLFLYLALNNKFSKLIDRYPNRMRRLFYILLGLFLLMVVIVWTVHVKSLMLFFWLVLLLHVVYVVYIHLRRTEMKQASEEGMKVYKDNALSRSLYWLMDLLHIPRVESGYFVWFMLVAITGIIVYVAAIISLSIAVNIGPFPLALLAFSVLLGFGNIVTIVSVRTSINWHVLIFLFAVLLGSKETHYVQISDQSKDRLSIYKQRQGVIDYFNNWITDSARGSMIDASSKPYDIYFVL
ncbi:MAG TPA: hypothetical protein VEB42_04070, partial [Chitinophagaceae bacterium]|nr:hypothetical protein [Chitinophagaceae bacterium]